MTPAGRRVVIDLSFPARNRSGIGTYGLELLPALRAAAAGEWQIDTFVAPGFEEKLRTWQKLGDAAGLLWGIEGLLPARLWHRRPALLHAPAFIAPLAPLPCPLVVTLHDTILEDGWQTFHPAWRLFHRLSVQQAVRRAAAILVPSQQTARDVGRVYGAGPVPIHVIPQGLSPVFRPLPLPAVAAILARYRLAPPYLLFAGAQVDRKNIVGLLAAYAQLRAEGRDAGYSLVIAGPPGNASQEICAAVARLGLHDAVRILGRVPLDDLVGLFNGAELFVFPSHYEGAGLPPLEAMACGVPVVTSHTGAIAEMVGDAALLVDANDTASIVTGMQRGLRDEALRTTLRTRGLARAAAFTWQRTAQATLDVYRQVAGI
jgi:glycosyltransferase involved in cell wall biosynthesis